MARKTAVHDLDERRREIAEARARRGPQPSIEQLLRPPLTQEEAHQERVRAAEEAERERLERVKRLAPTARKVKRLADAAGKRLAQAEEARAVAEAEWQEAYSEHLQLQDRFNRLAWGDDI